MEYYGANSKLQKILSDERMLYRHYGKQKADQIRLRLEEIQQASTLAEINTLPPTRLHQLQGSRKEQFSVDISKNWRMILEGYNEGEMLTVRKEEAVIVLIVSIEDYH